MIQKERIHSEILRFFFFSSRRRHTRFDCDWSSDVCSSDLVPDLRGYGDSSKPPDGENHANYSKRAMALDHIEVMRHFGFERFPVIGHDRGGDRKSVV